MNFTAIARIDHEGTRPALSNTGQHRWGNGQRNVQTAYYISLAFVGDESTHEPIIVLRN